MSLKNVKLGLIAFAGKIGTKVLPLIGKMVSGLKAGKVGIGLAGVSAAAYTYIFTWEFAALIMISLFIHESGHIWAMKKCGMKTKGIYFIPFVGGAAVADEDFPSRKTEVFVAIMGPIWGFCLVLIAGLVYLLTGNPIFAAAASWMAMVNLFNLLPINPLDGGRIMKSIAYSINSRIGLLFLIVGIIASAYIVIIIGFMLFLILLIIGGIELFFEYKRRTVLPRMGSKGIIASAFIYALVAIALWMVMSSVSSIPSAAAAMQLLIG